MANWNKDNKIAFALQMILLTWLLVLGLMAVVHYYREDSSLSLSSLRGYDLSYFKRWMVIFTPIVGGGLVLSSNVLYLNSEDM